MRQLINSTYITLDGVVENPHLWPALKRGISDEGDTIQTDLLATCDIVLMGRRTYDVFAPAWTSRGGDPYSDRINTMRKVVVSTTLTDPEWTNTDVIASDVVDRVRELKDQNGGHIVQYGFVTSRGSCSNTGSSTSSSCGSIHSLSDRATPATCCTAPARQRRSTSLTRGS
jgi:hypothetical protein